MKRLIVIAITIAVLAAMLFPTAAAGDGAGAKAFTQQAYGATSYHYVYARGDASGTTAFLYVTLSVEWCICSAEAYTYASQSQGGSSFASVCVDLVAGFPPAGNYNTYSSNDYYSHVWARGWLATYMGTWPVAGFIVDQAYHVERVY